MFSGLKKQIESIKANYFFPSIEKLTGNVLNIAFGNGETFSHYQDKSIVYAVEKKICVKKIDRAKKNAKCKLIIEKGNAEHLNFPNNFFDAVVVSFGLCSVDSLESTEKEIYRTLKEGGKLVLLEHIKSDSKIISTFQKLLTIIQSVFGLDCHLNRDPRYFLDNSKFQILSEKIFKNSIEPYLYLEAIKKK